MSEVVIDKGKKGKSTKMFALITEEKNETMGEEKNRVLCLNFGHSSLTGKEFK